MYFRNRSPRHEQIHVYTTLRELRLAILLLHLVGDHKACSSLLQKNWSFNLFLRQSLFILPMGLYNSGNFGNIFLCILSTVLFSFLENRIVPMSSHFILNLQYFPFICMPVVVQCFKSHQ
jgi:hypothetical protein